MSSTGTPPHNTANSSKRSGSGFKEFIGTLPGLLTGAAALITAIAGAFYGGTQLAGHPQAQPTVFITVTAQPSPASAATVAGGSPTTGAASPTTGAASPSATIFHSDYISFAEVDSNLSGGGSYYKNLSVDPPVTTTNYGEGDVYVLIGGSPPSLTMQANNGATVGMWHQSTAPTYTQCLQTAEAS